MKQLKQKLIKKIQKDPRYIIPKELLKEELRSVSNQFIDGKWYRPRMKNFTHECCNCGSKHRVDFKKNKIGIEFKWSSIKLNK